MSHVFAQPARSERAFERLYRRHAPDVYRYAYAVLQNRADAEDVTQTTFMNAYRALERGEHPERPHNWLIAIAHNVCRQRFRQSQRRPNEVEWQEDLADRFVADEEAPTADDIRRALSRLPFNQRAALVMRELEGRSYAEIGEMLDLTSAAVETLIFRARRALREQLEGTLTCGEAELAISKQLDGRLSRTEKGQLRAHLRECPECATFARRQRAQRTALKSLGAIPLPASLASLFGGGGTSAVVVAGKAAAIAAAAAVAGGASYEAVRSFDPPRPHHHAAPTTAAGQQQVPAVHPAEGLLVQPPPAGLRLARPDGGHGRGTRAHGAPATAAVRDRGRGRARHRDHRPAAQHGQPSASQAAGSPGRAVGHQAAPPTHGPANGHTRARGRSSAHGSSHGGGGNAASAHGEHGHGSASAPSAAGDHGSGSHGSGSQGHTGEAPGRSAPAPGPPAGTPPAQSAPGPPGKHGASFSP